MIARRDRPTTTPAMMARFMADPIVTAIYGRRGSGKTTRAKALIKNEKRVVVFDPIGEYGQGRGVVHVDSVAGVRDAMAKRWRSGFRIAYTPQVDLPGRLHALSLLLWDAQAPYRQRREGRPLTLVVDEANMAYPSTKLPVARQGMMRLVLQGRHAGIGIIAVTQRPALVSTDLRGNAAVIYAFALPVGHDVAAVAATVGRPIAAQLPDLPDHVYLRWESGRVTRSRNRL